MSGRAVHYETRGQRAPELSLCVGHARDLYSAGDTAAICRPGGLPAGGAGSSPILLLAIIVNKSVNAGVFLKSLKLAKVLVIF